MKAVKRAIPVGVEFARHAGCVETLEGGVRFDSGDAILTGVKGERWPVTRGRFETSYRALPPVIMGQDGQYVKIPVVVEVRQLTDDGEIQLDDRGTLHAHAGDWQVTAPDGDSWVVEAAVFEASYDLLDQDTACLDRHCEP